MHLTTYRCSDAQAIIHTHSKYAVAVGTIADELPAIHYTINVLGGPVRVVPFEVFGSRELAAAAAAAFVDRQGILLRNHGAVTYGSVLAQALDRTVKLEWLAEIYWHASVAGTPRILSAAELQAVRDQGARLAYEA
ncbi:class II aldolase/adducin N-terminal domain-containing protein [Antricoccus suffuscus]|uniref:Class II aldolase/adducin N-terminal domain-containing protein n=1 Tax=Antricoccus suffuscus TaxID=1629062 RepID=A0A2T1A102_9ACTN|nr:class II aldolase/adducin N-terminal domain-containing protein [Antricoccus suffuscus]